MKYLPLIIMAAAPLSAETLNVYTYDSFVSDWGPGPAIELGFEVQCDCDVVFTGVGDGAAMMTRLRLEGSASTADVAMGLDQNLAERAHESGLFSAHKTPDTLIAGTGQLWNDPFLTPFDWGHFAFVYRKADIEIPPANFEELAASDLKIVIQDPRSSSPGLGLAVWVADIYGDDTSNYWRELSDNIITVTPGWSEAYSLFLNGEADMVLSYSTSPAYHIVAEEDDAYTAAKFDEGHAIQIELAGVLKTSKNPDLAVKFLTYLKTPEAQSALVNANWMYPVSDIDLPEGFDDPSLIVTRPTASDIKTIEAAKSGFANGF